ncbi:glycoside hydrolase family 3 C-terminal domain-containing protein [Plantactinospora sp. S1510]|uniref:Glycoside hydrolase family 3 C-terminal domain-containing protein n=2 Tax=Plantactinospora alkalitolerans TaxID=2789879 RepID=A0ABS0H9B4_9ACTN|nr:glycoside hydrolase family 3 C-terminal domain-containing protein [Plantactinospora alkalitolerans]
MTIEEKAGQLRSTWLGGSATGDDLAPHQHNLADKTPPWSELIGSGLGQLTRTFGSAPVTVAEGCATLARLQAELVAGNRFGIPAIAHEECLTGFMTLGATIFSAPLSWGATFDPGPVERMAAEIGTAMRLVGVHQGMAPVLDVTRDLRWGRTEETIGEDPYLVGTVGAAYVRGLQSAGVVATLKHFAGYSSSRAGRNAAPVSIGHRELSDVILPPFEMAVRDAGARSVMPSYSEIDGVPTGADAGILTDLLRDEWGFTGTVISDYYAVSFLELLHGVADGPAHAAALALAAGVDVELPGARCFGAPLVEAVRSGVVPEGLVDRAVTRVLRQKCELGLLDPDWRPDQVGGDVVDLDPPHVRDLARQIAEESVVLLSNGGTLPLPGDGRIAVVGPLADDIAGMLGCYTFPSHLGRNYPDMPVGVEIRTVWEALGAELPDARLTLTAGCGVDNQDRTGLADARSAAAGADVCVAVFGDRAGMFGSGTSGEGCDVADLRLPGIQEELLDALLDTGTPVVLVLLSGRPYALGRWADRLAAVVQAFFPGQEGAGAVAGVLSGRVTPSGRLPVSVPRQSGGQPGTYLTPKLGRHGEVSSVDPTPLFPFGHGLSYTTFAWDAGGDVPAEIETDGALTVEVTVRNVGDRAGADVVQLYLHDPVAQVTRPVVQLIGYAKVRLEPGEARTVGFRVHAELTSFTGRAGHRIVEPGDIELRLSASSADHRHTYRVRLVGPERKVGHDRQMTTEVTIV